jgi:predicted deacetylase
MINSIRKFISHNTGMLIRLDDIAENMNWALMDKCEKLFDNYKIKPLLGVVPNNKDRELLSQSKRQDFWNKVRDWQKKGWEISMHGFTHVYDKPTNKKDYFGQGGETEFCGHSYEVQKERINNGLKIFKNEGINIRSFFAPNHTYDLNTFKALKEANINNIIDGYGLVPYLEKGIVFIPQLFYKEIMLPFGVQSTQIHLNYWNNKDFEKFERFILKNKEKLISFDETLNKKNNGYIFKIINILVEKILKLKRLVKN